MFNKLTNCANSAKTGVTEHDCTGCYIIFCKFIWHTINLGWVVFQHRSTGWFLGLQAKYNKAERVFCSVHFSWWCTYRRHYIRAQRFGRMEGCWGYSSFLTQGPRVIPAVATAKSFTTVTYCICMYVQNSDVTVARNIFFYHNRL